MRRKTLFVLLGLCFLLIHNRVEYNMLAKCAIEQRDKAEGSEDFQWGKPNEHHLHACECQCRSWDRILSEPSTEIYIIPFVCRGLCTRCCRFHIASKAALLHPGCLLTLESHRPRSPATLLHHKVTQFMGSSLQLYLFSPRYCTLLALPFSRGVCI